MVTIHGGHGWLLNQFFTPRVNTRSDKWGGTAENRARFAVEVCDAIHKLLRRGFFRSKCAYPLSKPIPRDTA
jgi:2,4-dienoyl-CoA reductase-like NADH-dependent reductase (Old Yellow Enzyme family)